MRLVLHRGLPGGHSHVLSAWYPDQGATLCRVLSARWPGPAWQAEAAGDAGGDKGCGGRRSQRILSCQSVRRHLEPQLRGRELGIRTLGVVPGVIHSLAFFRRPGLGKRASHKTGFSLFGGHSAAVPRDHGRVTLVWLECRHLLYLQGHRQVQALRSRPCPTSSLALPHVGQRILMPSAPDPGSAPPVAPPALLDLPRTPGRKATH